MKVDRTPTPVENNSDIIITAAGIYLSYGKGKSKKTVGSKKTKFEIKLYDPLESPQNMLESITNMVFLL